MTLINIYFAKLGLTDSGIQLKASELIRRLQLKLDSGGASIILAENVRIIACIQLAAEAQGISLEKDTAIRLSGLRKTAYEKQLHIIESLLGLDTHMSVKEICVRASLSELIDFAENILQRYIESQSTSQFQGQPVYSVAAVLTAAKKRKFKVDKSLLQNLSRVKTQALNDVTKSMLEIADSLESHVAKTPKKRKKDQERRENDKNKTPDKIKIEEKVLEEEEPYEIWKKRMLSD